MRKIEAWVFMILALTISGCGKKASFRSSGASANDGSQSDTGHRIPDFAHILLHEISSTPFNNVDSFISVAGPGTFTIREVEYVNSSDQPVILWVKSSASIAAQGEWLGYGYKIYDSRGTYSLNPLQVVHPQSGVTETQNPNELWKPVIIKSQESVQLRWSMSLATGFLLCVAGDLHTTIGDGGQGHYNFYQVDGDFTYQVRVTPVGTEEIEATADEDHLDPALVYVLEKKEKSPLVHSSALGLPDWSQPFERKGLCPFHS